MFVVDASVAGAWLLPDEQHPAALDALERLKEEDGYAPALLWYELRNLLLTCERRHRILPTQTATLLKSFHDLGLHTDPSPDSAMTLQLARDYGLSIYDATYLELALRLGCPLLTLDRTLADAARQVGVGMDTESML